MSRKLSAPQRAAHRSNTAASAAKRTGSKEPPRDAFRDVGRAAAEWLGKNGPVPSEHGWQWTRRVARD